MKTTPRNLTSRYFESSKLSRIYEDGKWLYTTNEDLSNCNVNDLSYFLRNGNYWRK